MRYTGTKKDISYEATQKFFESRGRHAQASTPETSTMYQDSKLAIQRDRVERDKIVPLLALEKHYRVLDIGCGYGRWAKELNGKIREYVGIDFSAELLRLAAGLSLANSRFVKLAAQQISAESLGDKEHYDIFICSGILIYLNDTDVENLSSAIVSMAKGNSKVYIREPMALQERLTLDRVLSEELQHEYSAIYRTVSQCKKLFGGPLISAGFQLELEEPLYPPALCNRKETMQYVQLWGRA